MLNELEAVRDEISAQPALLTLGQAIAAHAASRPEAPAIIVEGRGVTSYGALARQVERTGAVLKQAGIGAKSRVAVVMPDNGDLAAIIAAIACHATVMPLNPRLTAAEIDELFGPGRLDAIILEGGADIPARAAAMRREACLLEATPGPGGVELALKTRPLSAAAASGASSLDDAVLILRTSGSTARAKLVPVTHRYLNLAMEQRRHWFGLGPSDRALAAAPIYYAQGAYALCTTLMIGGSLACPARASGTNFCDWLKSLEPTYYSAGPTLHRSVLEQALAVPKGTLRHHLRFIQSGGAPLPKAIKAGLEEVFGIPVCEEYGMTETGSITSNSIAPEGRRAGTLGKPYGLEPALQNADGSIVATGGPAEVVVRGVMTPGYIDDPEANRAAFIDGWFHTGDLGCIDADGFLTLVGRVKEMINRGGEKIAPAEIDQALLRHPAVAEAASFGVPHPRLGEDVAAVAVLRPGHSATPLELRRFLRATLVPFKIPRRIHILPAIPKGDTGKVQRRNLAALVPAPVKTGPTVRPSSLEAEIAEIWGRLLERSGADIDRDDEFFELGGDSLLATQMILEVERLTGKQLPEDTLFEAATPRQIAQRVIASEKGAEQGLMARLQPGTGKPPFVFIDGDFWGGGFYARQLAIELGPDHPFYNFHAHGCYTSTVPSSIEEMAADYRQLLAAAGVRGPFRLGGHCNGAIIAWELARQLVEAGERVELVAMIEPITLNARPSMRALARALAGTDRRGRGASAMGLVWQAWHVAQFLQRKFASIGAGDDIGLLTQRLSVLDPLAAARSVDYRRAMASYVPPKLEVEVLCLLAQSHARSRLFAAGPWRRLTPRLEVAIVPGEHLTCITTHVDSLALRLRQRLEALDAGPAAAKAV